MNKTISITGIILLLTIGIVTAATSGPITVVYGKVTNIDGSNAIGTKITTTCNGITKATVTNTEGLYQTNYMRSQCTIGNTVKIIAKSTKYYAAKTAIVTYNNTLGYNQARKDITLNIKI